jgi:hypothetical protein
MIKAVVAGLSKEIMQDGTIEDSWYSDNQVDQMLGALSSDEVGKMECMEGGLRNKVVKLLRRRAKANLTENLARTALHETEKRNKKEKDDGVMKQNVTHVLKRAKQNLGKAMEASEAEPAGDVDEKDQSSVPGTPPSRSSSPPDSTTTDMDLSTCTLFSTRSPTVTIEPMSLQAPPSLSSAPSTSASSTPAEVEKSLPDTSTLTATPSPPSLSSDPVSVASSLRSSNSPNSSPKSASSCILTSPPTAVVAVSKDQDAVSGEAPETSGEVPESEPNEVLTPITTEECDPILQSWIAAHTTLSLEDLLSQLTQTWTSMQK